MCTTEGVTILAALTKSGGFTVTGGFADACWLLAETGTACPFTSLLDGRHAVKKIKRIILKYVPILLPVNCFFILLKFFWSYIVQDISKFEFSIRTGHSTACFPK